MREEQREILEMENRILAEKQLLNEYIQRFDSPGDSLMQEKLKGMQESLDSLQREFLLFKDLVEYGNDELEPVGMEKPETEGMKTESGENGQPEQEGLKVKSEESEKPELRDMKAESVGMEKPEQRDMKAESVGMEKSELEGLKAEPVENEQPEGMKAELEETTQPEPEGMKTEPLKPENIRPEASAQKTQRDSYRKRGRDIEKTVGKSLMGIIASGFIFLSIVMFAVMLLPTMSDAFKIAAMFFGSAVFTLAGFMNLKREKYRSFFLVLSGCGIGAFYVSLLVTRFYFKAIGMLPFYALVLVWAVLVCVLSRKKSQGFQWIGQSGILISVIFCSDSTIAKGEYSLFFLLLVFYAGTSLLFTLLHYEKELVKNIPNFFFNLAGCLVFLIAFQTLRMRMGGSLARWTEDSEYNPAAVFCLQIASILLIVYIISQIVLLYRTRSGERVLLFSILQLLQLKALMEAAEYLSDTFFSGEAWIYPVQFLLVLGALSAYEYRHRTVRFGLRFLCEAVSIFWMTGALLCWKPLEWHISIIPVVLGLLLAGYLLKNRFYLYLSLGMLFFFRVVTFFENSFPSMERVFWTLVYIGMCLLLHHFIGKADTEKNKLLDRQHLNNNKMKAVQETEKKRKKNPAVQMVWAEKMHLLLVYVSAVYLVPVDLKELLWFLAPDMLSSLQNQICNWIACILIGSINLAVQRHFQKEAYEGLPGIRTIGSGISGGVQILCMVFTLSIITQLENEVLHILLILFAIALFSVNTRNLMGKYKGLLCGAYIGLKFTLLLYVILGSFKAPNVVISTGSLLFAILCIAVGFRLRYKPLRIYGLVLSILSTMKLILVDLAYGNAGELALGFFICGILCFGISMIYHVIDRKYKE